jgi:hypothetical protein
MKRFLIKFFLFFLFVFSVFFIVTLVIGRVINKGNFFAIDKTKQNLIFGHSHAECSYNDSLINGFKNFAQSGESYFYTYIKLKKILENNKHIKTCFVEFTNNNIEHTMDQWIWGDQHITNRYPMYAAFMTSSDIFLLTKHNPFAIINTQSAYLKSNFLFLKNKKIDYLYENNWGRYLYLDKIATDSFLTNQNRIFGEEDTIEISKMNLQYLRSIVNLCANSKVKLYFVRSPAHQNCRDSYNEQLYKQIMGKEFSDVEFLDFKNFFLPNGNYADFEHLNNKGAKLYSIFFNKLILDGFLEKKNKQYIIDTTIANYMKAKTEQ